LNDEYLFILETTSQKFDHHVFVMPSLQQTVRNIFQITGNYKAASITLRKKTLLNSQCSSPHP